MSDVDISAVAQGRYLVSGPLQFQTVAEARKRGLRLLFAHPDLVLDLAGVTRADSAGLALLIEWMREGRNRGIRVHFENIPNQLLAIARASQLDKFLP